MDLRQQRRRATGEVEMATKKSTRKKGASIAAVAGAPPARKRNRLFVVRLNEAERTMIDVVAEHHGMNATQILRMLVRREHDRIRSALR